jgi:hypothetical protein
VKMGRIMGTEAAIMTRVFSTLEAGCQSVA